MSKKYFALLIFILIYGSNTAQYLSANIHAGLANYQGDLQRTPFTFKQSKGNIGISVTYMLTPLMGVRAGGFSATIGADDKNNKNDLFRLRNLNFTNKIKESYIGLQVNTKNLDEKVFTIFGFIGAAFYSHNPYTLDASGKKIYLAPLSTEGQGLPEYPNRKSYKLNGVSIPFSGGIQVNLANNVVLGYELMLHKTFTDFLDDVSQFYPDFSTLLNRRGPTAVALSYRANELPNGVQVFPQDTEIRGGSKRNNDWYYMQCITIGVHLVGKNKGIFGHKNDYKTKCPTLF